MEKMRRARYTLEYEGKVNALFNRNTSTPCRPQRRPTVPVPP